MSHCVVSLFAGVGGFDYGFEQAGFETVFQCEIDERCRDVLHRHFPTADQWGDITTLTGKHIITTLAARGKTPDVIIWGSPCQDLSVAGKRAGLEGGRSGLFFEGMRIINELRKESNGIYPRISIWENVYGALNSNKGDDFEVILKEMVEAGSLLCEWRVLDAQYFGIPQRRRRVFVVAVFDSATATRCPDPLLPVSEGLRWNPKTGANTGQELADTATTSVRKHRALIGSDIVGSLAACDQKGISNQYVSANKCVVQDEPASTLNVFDQGDVRATTAIVFENSYRDGARISKNNVTQTLSAKMGTGGGNTPILAQEPLVFQPGTMVRLNGGVWDGVVPTLRAEAKRGDNEPHITYSIQDGRAIEKNQKGLGVAEEGASAYTIDTISAPAVAFGIQGSMIGRQDHNGPGGQGVTQPDGAMYTLTQTDVHAVVQYDGYNQKINDTDVSVTLRLGRDSSDFVAQPVVAPSLTASNDPFRSPQSSEITQQVAAVHATSMIVRRLTPLECERLMGWPDDWTAGQADTHRYKMCGNGVASPVAQWIGEQLMKVLDDGTRHPQQSCRMLDLPGGE